MDEAIGSSYATPSVTLGSARHLSIDILAAALVGVGVAEPSDTLLTPIARAIISLWIDKSDADAPIE